MPGLRFLACERCGTVHAEPEAPRRCRDCRAAELVDITSGLRRDRYFERA